MKLYDLLKDVKIKCHLVDLNEEVLGITSDSRKVLKGYLFVAIKGENRNGNDYILDAYNNGAIAVVSQENNIYLDIPYIKVDNDREALSKIWNSFYEYPTKNMKVIAFTGTNGKTSCVHLLKSILRNANKKYGVISTIGSEINGNKLNLSGGSDVSDVVSSMTTPDPEILYRILNDMKNDGVEYVVMEASSHSLNQHKLAGIEVFIGAFTNLSSEHLDYHKNIENYYDSKKKLFKTCKIGVVNFDKEYGKRLKNEFENLKTVSKIQGDFHFENIICNQEGCTFDFYNGKEKIQLKSKLIGNFVPENIALAVSCACLLEISTRNIQEGILECEYIEGRMEKIYKNIYVDYAHTPEAFENVLSSCKRIFNKKIIVLFGCGGDRDKTKRSLMGEIASKYANKIIITSDNSRGENKLEIIKDILKGIDIISDFYVIPNRKNAIKFAVKNLNDEYVLLLLGKGHEKYEIDKNGKHDFDEKKIVMEVIDNV